MLLIFIFIFVFGNVPAKGLLDELAKFLGDQASHYYAIVVDAGSSRSRVHVFHFREPLNILIDSIPLLKPAHLVLVSEFTDQIKPGLSSYANTPEQGAQTIVDLIKKAEVKVPEDKRSSTIVMVRGTAGLRSLPPETARTLLDTVALAISQLNFAIESTVGILTDTRRGIYNWYTINYLFNTLKNRRTTWGALDLGGESTHITFELTHFESQLVQYPSSSQFRQSVGDRTVTLLSHSYPQLGGNSARHGIFMLESNGTRTLEMTSVCVHPDIQNQQWNFQNQVLTISGALRNGITAPVAYSRCRDLVQRYMSNNMQWKPKSKPGVRFAALDDYFTYAEKAGLIDTSDTKNNRVVRIKVKDFHEAALRHYSNVDKEHPWLCHSLVLVYTLLHDGYKMDDNDEIHLLRTVDGITASWALGCAYSFIIESMERDKRAYYQMNPYHKYLTATPKAIDKTRQDPGISFGLKLL